MCRSFEKLIAFIVCTALVNVEGGTFKSMTMNKCMESNDNGVKFIDLSIAQCVDACIRRQTCKYVEYKRRMQFCQLHNEDVLLTQANEESCVFIAKNDMDIAQANKCQCSLIGHVCNLVSGKCEIKECNPLDLPNGQLYGNRQFVGNKLGVTCNKGYKERSGIKQVICNRTCEWDHTPTCELAMKEYYCPYLSDYPNYYLVDLHSDGFPIDKQTSIAFEVKGKNDAHILLQRDGQDTNYYVIEIVLGGWVNTKSVIRTARGQNSVFEYVGTELDRGSYKPFWMSWSYGCVKVGRGSSVGLNMFMEWCGLTFNINNMRISFGWKSDGYFKLPF